MFILLEAGADPNALNNTADTPLHKAAWKNQPEACQMLLDWGADRYARNADGDTPVRLAADNEASYVLQEVFDMGFVCMGLHGRDIVAQCPADRVVPSRLRSG